MIVEKVEVADIQSAPREVASSSLTIGIARHIASRTLRLYYISPEAYRTDWGGH